VAGGYVPPDHARAWLFLSRKVKYIRYKISVNKSDIEVCRAELEPEPDRPQKIVGLFSIFFINFNKFSGLL
jgi:hypothetical protein